MLTLTKKSLITMFTAAQIGSQLNAMDSIDSSYIRCSDRIGGPVYAAKWERINQYGKQIILLYGDEHHTVHTKNKAQECNSCTLIKTFFEELNLVQTKTLLLYENDSKSPFWDNFLSSQDKQVLFSEYFPEGDKVFGSILSGYASNLKTPCYLQAVCIEQRTILSSFFRIALDYLCLLSTQEPLSDDRKRLLKPYATIYNVIKDVSISEVLEWPIVKMKDFLESTSDNVTKEIFSEVITTLQERKKLLWKEMATETGLSYDELDPLTLNAIVMFAKEDTRYAKVVKFLESKSFRVWFAAETIEATALHYINDKQNYNSKIVIVTGFQHVRNLEKYLSRLSFLQNACGGHDFICADEDTNRALTNIRNAADPRHASRVFPLSSADTFGLSLFSETISKAIEQMEAGSKSLEQETLAGILLANQYRYDALEQANHLVSLETLEWINEVNEEPQKNIITTIERCLICAKEKTDGGKALFRCSRCKKAFYCSSDCQKKDWPLHKKQCSL